MTTNNNANIGLSTLAARIDQLIEAEKAIDSHETYLTALKRRREISEIETKLSTAFQGLVTRISRLSILPDEEHVMWASAVLMMNPLFLVLDTTGLSNDADIIRVFMRDENGVLFDSLVQPVRQPHAANTRFTGISPDDLDHAPTLSDIWGKIGSYLKGRYILCYGMEFVKGRMDENAKYYGLTMFPMLRKCLQRATAQYFNSYSSMKLTDACKRIGYPLPTFPTAPERALGQVQLLLAMMQGITTAPQPVPSSEPSEPDTSLELDDLPDHPF